MDTFEDENPFEHDAEHISSETSSTSKVDLSPSSPPYPTRQLSPSSPSRPFPSPGSHKQLQTTVKSDFCCVRDRYLHSGDDVEILITDAQKTSVNATSPYITYIIKTGTAEAHHRYSEFESLRANLVKLYPTLIIPPIPSKQTLGDYAVKQGKAKEDATLIARRKRMLQTFLNRIARHPILSNEHVFHRFLDGEVSWTEVLNSPPLSLLPKNILKAPSHNPTDQNASPAYDALPNPSAAHPLRHPDQRFSDSEAFTNKFANHVSGPMEKVTRRAIKRWSEFAQDHADLGGVLNGFSLNETGALAGAVEKTGQAADATYMSTSKLLQELEQNWAEPLHEYSQFASIIKKLLAYRHQKHVQYEMTHDGLENKREQLEDLEKSEREARRLEEALGRGRINSGQLPRSPATECDEAAHEGEDTNTREEEVTSPASYLPPHPGPNPARRRAKAPGMGLLNALSYTLHGMMDVDPESARRNSITKARETISQISSMSTSEPWLDGQVVLILCGLVGSGKSTFATQLQQHYPQFHRCNQDDLGDRRQVERLARDCLARGLSVCIDRTNFDSAQRSYWIQIAHEFPGTSIWVIVFDTPYEVCAARLRTRTSHPTIKDAEQGLYVLSRFAADFEYPVAREGFDRIISLKPEDTPLVYSSSDIASILHKVHVSPGANLLESIPVGGLFLAAILAPVTKFLIEAVISRIRLQ
ncbi:hypothetical protein H0H87_007497 [Tephrocybe sp. NHM501043]|nr:hypothetical protein H0H87_007497 [Tephrocybe sp. NHM501043]